MCLTQVGTYASSGQFLATFLFRLTNLIMLFRLATEVGCQLAVNLFQPPSCHMG